VEVAIVVVEAFGHRQLLLWQSPGSCGKRTGAGTLKK
jgi:hypothetical protein